MSKNYISLSKIGLSFVTFASLFIVPKTFAQSNSPIFNKEECIQRFVTEGLKSSQASIWCNYKEECMTQSKEEGLPFDSAKTVCNCTISEFRNKYSTEEFKELTQQINSNKKIARQLREVGEMCFEKILFE